MHEKVTKKRLERLELHLMLATKTRLSVNVSLDVGGIPYLLLALTGGRKHGLRQRVIFRRFSRPMQIMMEGKSYQRIGNG